MSSRPSRNRSSALLSILFGWLFLAGLVSPPLHGSIPRDRHPTVELLALIEGPPAAERVASAFPTARLELGISDEDSAILRRVLVRQNPWSAFDPEGLSTYSDMGDYVGRTGSKGGVVNLAKAFGVSLLAVTWNAFSFGSAEKNGRAGDKYGAGDISGRQFAGQLTANTATAVAKGAVVYGTGGMAAAGTSVTAAMAVGAGTGAAVETLDIANDRGNAAIEGRGYEGTVGGDLVKVARGAGTGAVLAGTFQVGANSLRAGMEGYAQASLPEFNGTTTTNMVTDQLEYVTVTNSARRGARHPYKMADGHSETNAAQALNDLRGNNATAFHNNPEGTCPNCNNFTGGFLKPGKSLLVVPPANAVPRKPSWNVSPKLHTNTGKSAYE